MAYNLTEDDKEEIAKFKVKYAAAQTEEEKQTACLLEITKALMVLKFKVARKLI